MPGFAALNEVLNKPGTTATSFMLGQHTTQDFYTWMAIHPVQQNAFQGFMKAQVASLPSWLEAMPECATETATSAAATDTVSVNVGVVNGQL